MVGYGLPLTWTDSFKFRAANSAGTAPGLRKGTRVLATTAMTGESAKCGNDSVHETLRAIFLHGEEAGSRSDRPPQGLFFVPPPPGSN